MTESQKHRQQKENIKQFVFTDKDEKLEIVVPEVGSTKVPFIVYCTTGFPSIVKRIVN